MRGHGGKTFVDAGNSHPENFWDLLTEEHRRWKCDLPPVSPFWNRRSREMMEHVDYVLCPSSFVRESFLVRGFRPEQILRNVNVAYSIGLQLTEEGSVVDVFPEMVAAKAGIGPGMKIVAVNGRQYSGDVLRGAIRDVLALA